MILVPDSSPLYCGFMTTLDLVNNRIGNVEGLTRAQISQRVVGILKSFVKAGKLRKYGRVGKWLSVGYVVIELF